MDLLCGLRVESLKFNSFYTNKQLEEPDQASKTLIFICFNPQEDGSA